MVVEEIVFGFAGIHESGKTEEEEEEVGGFRVPS